MKYLLIIPLLLMSAVMGCNLRSSTSLSEGYVSVTGIFDIPNDENISLSKVKHGELHEIATCSLNGKGEYGFQICPDDEGFYILGTRWSNMPIYLKGNQTFVINFSSTDGFSQVNIPDDENRIVDNWYHSNDTLASFDFRRPKSKTYEDFFPFYESFILKMQDQHIYVDTDNRRFNQLMHALIDIKIEYTALHFLFTPRIKHPSKEDFPDFYFDFMDGRNFKKAIILDVPEGFRALRSHQQFKSMYTDIGMEMRSENLLWSTMDIENDTLRAYYALEGVKRFKSYNEDYLKFIEPLRKDIALSPYVSDRIEELEVQIKTMEAGQPGYDFTYEDVSGGKVSFSDFKGKYVYIDAWATWCAPCKKEIPYLKELEKKFQNKDILFVSISLDKKTDKEKWKIFVEENELGGIQLITEDAFNTRIAKDYKIKTIPRFLLFDPEGKIIDANAKRPSNPDLEKQLNELL